MLRFVYDRLDAVLDALRVEGGHTDMAFPDLGIDLRLVLRRTGDHVVVEPHAGSSAPPDFQAVDGRAITVDAEGFIDEWMALRGRLRRAAAQA